MRELGARLLRELLDGRAVEERVRVEELRVVDRRSGAAVDRLDEDRLEVDGRSFGRESGCRVRVGWELRVDGLVARERLDDGFGDVVARERLDEDRLGELVVRERLDDGFDDLVVLERLDGLVARDRLDEYDRDRLVLERLDDDRERLALERLDDDRERLALERLDDGRERLALERLDEERDRLALDRLRLDGANAMLYALVDAWRALCDVRSGAASAVSTTTPPNNTAKIMVHGMRASRSWDVDDCGIFEVPRHSAP